MISANVRRLPLLLQDSTCSHSAPRDIGDRLKISIHLFGNGLDQASTREMRVIERDRKPILPEVEE